MQKQKRKVSENKNRQKKKIRVSSEVKDYYQYQIGEDMKGFCCWGCLTFISSNDVT